MTMPNFSSPAPAIWEEFADKLSHTSLYILRLEECKALEFLVSLDLSSFCKNFINKCCLPCKLMRKILWIENFEPSIPMVQPFNHFLGICLWSHLEAKFDFSLAPKFAHGAPNLGRIFRNIEEKMRKKSNFDISIVPLWHFIH